MQVPISEGGTVQGTDVGKIKAGGDGVGLRVYDPGYVNTAAVISKICFIDGNKGILRYRGYPIEEVRGLLSVSSSCALELASHYYNSAQIALKSDFLSTSHCLLYGELPGKTQSEEFRSTVMRYSKLPAAVVDAMEALPTNAHPMSVVMSAVVAMGALHPEQNPALSGNSIYKDKAVQDTQIVRLLGAMPTIASYAYYRCALCDLSPAMFP